MSDREQLATLPGTAAYIEKARARRGGEELMPAEAAEAPITPERFLSLATKVYIEVGNSKHDKSCWTESQLCDTFVLAVAVEYTAGTLSAGYPLLMGCHPPQQLGVPFVLLPTLASCARVDQRMPTHV